MKAFFFKLMVVLLPFALLFFYVEYGLAGIRNDYTVKNTALTREDDTELLVFGNSHSFYAVNPALLHLKGYSLANPSQTLYYDRELLRKAIASKSNLQHVVLNASYLSLWTDSHEGAEQWREYHYHKFMNVTHPELNIWSPKAHSYVALYSLGNARDYFFQGFEVDLARDLNDYGWDGHQVGDSSLISEENGRERVAYHHRGMRRDNLFDWNAQLLEDMVSMATSEGIGVTIITTPVYKTYRAYMDEGMEAQNLKTINDIAEKHGAQYLDYSADPRFEKEDFYDNDHLNYKGAEKFTLILDKEVIQHN